jgi:protocatechuate 4,5-dioxygenase, beta chain
VAELVGGFCVPHVPLVASQFDNAPADKQKLVMDAYATVTRRLKELRVDTVVMIGDDHYTIYGTDIVPRCLIGIGEVEGPVEEWLGIARRPIANNTALAEHIMREGFRREVDWAVSKTLVMDHSITIPYHFAVAPLPEVRMVPIYLCAAVEPLISSARARRIGEITGDAIRSFPGAARVAVIGTGGISHWVGMARMGDVNESFDRRILELVQSGDVGAMVALQDQAIIDSAGNGALEIKNWIFAMAALGPKTRAEVIAYAPIPQWVSGFGFVELKAA